MFSRLVAAAFMGFTYASPSQCDKDFDKFKENVKSNSSITIYDTQAHQDLFRAMNHQAKSLLQGRFSNSNGPHSRLLQGPKGIGKSTMLVHFLAEQAHHEQHIIPLYISYDELLMTGSVLGKQSLLNLLVRELKNHKIEVVMEGEENLGIAIIRALQIHNKYVFLVLDEIDQLYRVSPVQQSVYFNALTVLGDLAWLGNQKSGRFSVFLCGSSASCPLLVTCHANPLEFPLQTGAPNLNGQRFKTLRLSVPVFTNLQQLQDLLGEMGGPRDEQTARLVAFQVGVVPRLIESLMHAIEGAESATFQSFRGHRHESGLRSELSPGGLLYEAIMERLRQKNTSIRELLADDITGAISPIKVAEEDWGKHFQPLNYEDVTGCWARICDSHPELLGRTRDLEYLQSVLFALCDQGKVTYENIDRGLPMLVYPVCGAQVFLERTDISTAQEVAATLDQMLLRNFQRVFEKVENALIDKYT